jgi:hypothetical protein
LKAVFFDCCPGKSSQVQLELNGRYRDGSIEENGKHGLHTTRLGKRVDPAFLAADYDNHYSLRIYPVPPHGTRKITMTIQQLMSEEANRLNYFLPLSIRDTVGQFTPDLAIQSKDQAPSAEPGTIE